MKLVRTRCRHCGERFEAQRRSARYCCPAHRVAAHWRRTNGKANAKPPCDDEWYTPRDIIEAARAALGAIDLDPAAHALPQTWIKAAKFFVKSDDGLARPWRGRVWLNPPYSSGLLGRFVEKLLAELRAGNVSAAILLTNTSSASGWYHDALAACSAVCTPRGRVRFEKTDGTKAAPRYDSTFFFFGDDVAAFRAVFEPLGAVMSPARPAKIASGFGEDVAPLVEFRRPLRCRSADLAERTRSKVSQKAPAGSLG